MIENRAGVIAVGPGVGDDAHLQRRQRAVLPRAGLDGNPHRVARGGRDELLFPRQLELDRTPSLERRQHDDIFGQHLLLAAEAAADPFAEHSDLGRFQIEQIAQRPAGEERHLRAGTDVEHAAGVLPGDRAVGLERRMLDTLRDVDALVHHIGLGEAYFDIAMLPFDLSDEIALRVIDAAFRPLVVQKRRVGAHRLLGVEHRRQHLVVHLEPPATLFGGGFAVGDHGSHPLADEANHIVEHAGVVRIVGADLMARRGIQPWRRILEGEDGHDARHCHRRGAVDGANARMRVG